MGKRVQAGIPLIDPAQMNVNVALDGLRVDRAVAILTGLSRAQTTRLITNRKVQVNGTAVTSGSRKLRLGELIKIDSSAIAPDDSGVLRAQEAIDVNIVFVDDDVIVVDKPAGLVVHPGAGNPDGTLVNALLARFPELATRDLGERFRPGVVHRLDKGTSGLMVVARSEPAYRQLKTRITERLVERAYTALLAGSVENDSAIIDAPVGRSSNDPTRMAISWRGKPAQTTYTVLRHFSEPSPTTLVEARLGTGRTHQLRVHFAAVGHPVIGDPKYTKSTGDGRDAARAPKGIPSLDRPFLHAHRLSFDHPVDDRRLEFHSPLPYDLQSVISQLQ